MQLSSISFIQAEARDAPQLGPATKFRFGQKAKNMKAIFSALVVIFLGLFMVSVGRADSVIVWGNLNYGNSSLTTNVPANATNITALAAGDDHCLALRADGTVVAWGDNFYGQTNVPSNLTNVVSIAAGSTHCLALRKDGTVAMWGTIWTSGVTNAPSNATNIAALGLGPGAQHVLALRSDGTVLDWGNIAYGASLTNTPLTARNVVAVAAGNFFGLALRSDGKVVAWGYDQGTSTAVPTAATNIVAIATGWNGCAALRADGTVLVWGSAGVAPSGFTSVVDLVCPLNHPYLYFAQGCDVLALRRNGTLIEYSSSVPAYATNNISVIAAGSYTGIAAVGSGPPIFSGLPISRTVAIGSRAYFRALAVGAMPMSYQWTCNGTNLPGMTNTVLVLTNVQPAQAGNFYSLIASNSLGTATNGAMFLNELPVDFAVQPQILSAFVGATASFTTAYTNGIGPFSFQWQFGNTNLPNATNSSLSLTNVQLNQAGSYSFIVSNSYGSATNTAALTVMPLVFNAVSTNVMMTTNGFQFRLDSVYATNAVFIFASTDLVNWLPILTNPPTTGSVLFLDASATNMPQRFYRAMEQ